MAFSDYGKVVVILQSNYIPWKGYFDLICAADEFVIYDEVQYTRRDWRNRNKIVAVGKVQWLTIPVATKGSYDAPINTVKVAEHNWAEKHWTSLRHAYGKTGHFRDVASAIEKAYEQASHLQYLTEINELFLRTLCAELGIDACLSRTEDIPRRADNPTERLVEICQARGADTYVSGPSAKAYIQRERFRQSGINLAYADYGGYPVYDQGVEPFEHGVSMLDLLFRFGRRARQHLKTVSGGSALYTIE